MTGKYTPGPWQVGEHDYADARGFVLTVNAGEHNICEISLPDATDEANARLIAAAPEMAEALKQALAALDAVNETDINGSHDRECDCDLCVAATLCADAPETSRAALKKAGLL